MDFVLVYLFFNFDPEAIFIELFFNFFHKILFFINLGDKQCEEELFGKCDNGKCQTINGQRKCICNGGFKMNSNGICSGKDFILLFIFCVNYANI